MSDPRTWDLDTSLSQHRFIHIFAELRNHGKEVSPRGQKVLELENYDYELPPFVRFANFKARKLNIRYIKKEFLWYLRGDKFDTSIMDHAQMWRGLVNADGSINSNYGQYIFRGVAPGRESQFERCARLLREDRDSRRASIVILNNEHLSSDTADVPCTYAINFRIRRGQLNMTVRMRSQDAIFGMGNDAPMFSMLHEMMWQSLRAHYPDLGHGLYHHSADSFHAYERHFQMLDDIWEEYPDLYEPVPCPRMSGPEEVGYLLAGDFADIPAEYAFTRWLKED